MEIKCPHCAATFKVKVSAESTYSDIEQAVIDDFFKWIKGNEPYKSRFEKLNHHEFEFRVQIYDSPEGDTWVNGILEWTPGRPFGKLEIKEMR